MSRVSESYSTRFPTVEVKSLQVLDITPLLRGNLYDDFNEESKVKVDKDNANFLNNDYIIKFNPSIAPLIDNFYLCKYRAFSICRGWIRLPLSHYINVADRYSADFQEPLNIFTRQAVDSWTSRNLGDFLDKKVPDVTSYWEVRLDDEKEQSKYSNFFNILKLVLIPSLPEKYSEHPERLVFKFFYIVKNRSKLKESDIVSLLLDQLYVSYQNLIGSWRRIIDILTSPHGHAHLSMLDVLVSWIIGILNFLKLPIHVSTPPTLTTSPTRAEFIPDLVLDRNTSYQLWLFAKDSFENISLTDFSNAETLARLIIAYEKNPASWYKASRDFALHPYSSGWNANKIDEGAGFAILKIINPTSVQLQVQVVREFLYEQWPVMNEDKTTYTRRRFNITRDMGDARILRTKVSDFEPSIHAGSRVTLAQFPFYISSDCGEVLRSAICLGLLYLTVPVTLDSSHPAGDKVMLQWLESGVIFDEKTYNLKNHYVCGGKINDLSDLSEQQYKLWTTLRMKQFNRMKNFIPHAYGRNWSIFLKSTKSTSSVRDEEEDTVYFSLQFLPHRVVKVDKENDCELFLPIEEEGEGEGKEQKRSSILLKEEELSEFYTFQYHYHFSLGTPAIPYNEREYIAVGHSRFSINPGEGLSAASTDNFVKFTKDIEQSIEVKTGQFLKPPRHYYFMYFYTFDSETFAITRMSHSFQAGSTEEHGPYWLQFAAGIANVTGIGDGSSFIVSYGEGDIRCKLMIISKPDIEKILIPIDKMVIDPEVHQFIELVKSNHVEEGAEGSRKRRQLEGEKEEESSSISSTKSLKKS